MQKRKRLDTNWKNLFWNNALFTNKKNYKTMHEKRSDRKIWEKCREIPWTIGQLVFFVDVIRIYLEIQIKMTSCHPGFIPKLLGCASDINDDEQQCQEVSLSCALLSLIVALAIPTTLGLIFCYIFSKRNSSSDQTTPASSTVFKMD